MPCHLRSVRGVLSVALHFEGSNYSGCKLYKFEVKFGIL